jgi:hypothetical protein
MVRFGYGMKHPVAAMYTITFHNIARLPFSFFGKISMKLNYINIKNIIVSIVT